MTRARHQRRYAVVAMALLAGAGCAEPRSSSAMARVTWQGDIAALVAPCTECHGGAAPAAGYSLASYAGALGGGSDQVPNAIAGDAGSRLLRRLEEASEADVHHLAGQALATLRRWVVDSELAALSTPLHAAGVLDPASRDFHGAQVAALGWDLGRCARCHGDDFRGGTSGASCESCHVGGPTDCKTCHPLDEAQAPRGAQGGARPYGAGALDGAHRGHAAAGLACGECHRVPEAWDSEGHLRRSGASASTAWVADAPPAELDFAAAARRAGAAPSYDGERCSGVYCHGATLRDGGGAAPAPRWRDEAPASCGSCHGAPPPSHADDRCAACHPAPAARHLDGAVQIGAVAGCSGCHGDARSPAPPRDLSGNTATSALGVGAHRAHLEAQHRLRGPIACEACHQVPAELGAPGHLDSPGPAEVTASLGWDRAAQTCATAWCHGQARPRWTSLGEVSCGSCHGIPPSTAAHAPDLPLTSCAGCHPRSVDAFGNILFGPDGLTSEHADGDVDLP